MPTQERRPHQVQVYDSKCGDYVTEPTSIYDSINIEYEPEQVIPTALSDISFPRTHSSFSTDPIDDLISPVQKSTHPCAIDDQRSPIQGVLSAPSSSMTPNYAHISNKSATKLSVINKTTSSDFLDGPSRQPNGPHSSNNLFSLASYID